MATLKKRRLRRTFTGKCGADEDPSGDHLWFYFLDADGAVLAHTKLSHGADNDIGEPLLSKIAQDVNLNSRGLVDLVNCTMDAGTFYANLVA